jgi:hypothetical protein
MSSRSSRGKLRSFVFGAGLIISAPAAASAQLLDSTTPLRPPQDVQEAEDAKISEYMRAGFAEYRKKNLEGAREAFVKAWETARRPTVAAALADVEMKLGRYRDAAEHWDYYLRTKPTDRAEAAARLDQCRVHVAVVRVELEPMGAELDVDDTRVPTGGSGGTVWLEPGAHTFTARSGGRASSTLRIDATAGQDVSIRLVVDAAPVPAAAPPPVVKPPPPLPGATAWRSTTPQDAPSRGIKARTVVAIGGATLTLVSAGLGVWFVTQRNSADNERQQILNELDRQFPERAQTRSVCADWPDRPSACSEVFAKSSEADRAGNWAIGSFVGAGVFGVATVVTYVLWPQKEHAGVSAMSVAPLPGRDTRGLQARFQF